MKRFTALIIMMAMVIGALPAHAAEPTEKWAAVKKQCVELGLQVTWYPYNEGLMRRYGTDRMLLVEGGQSYLCKLNGDIKLAGPFDAFGEFNGAGLAPACQNGKWGVVNGSGKAVVDFLYDTQAQAEAAGNLAQVSQEVVDEDALHEGLRRVQDQESGLWGFVNGAGELVVPSIFDAVGYFDRGYASILADGVFGLLRNPLLNAGGAAAIDKDITFTDVPAGSWFEKGVMTCAQNGIMVGVGEGIFSPNATLTDAECAMLAYRIYDQANGGDGSVLKRPEGYGYIKLVSDDGSFVREGYAGDHIQWRLENFFYSATGYRLCFPGYYPEGLGAATLTFDGKEYRGTLKPMYRGSGRYEQDRFLGFEPEDPALNSLLHDAYWDATPNQWWSDLSYTVQQKGWDDIFDYIWGNEEDRGGFADLLGAVTDLPKKFDVPPIPDWGERGEKDSCGDHIYELYEAGILGGLDAYGTFASTKTLTRAEAAVMVARVLDESQRLTTPHKPAPTEGEGYTLTYLMDGIFASWYMQDTYPYCVVGDFGEEGGFTAFPVGLLTLEGEYVPWSDALWEKREAEIKAPENWQNWGGLDTLSTGGHRYCRSDGTPATEWFDWCGKIGPDGRGFVQKDGKLYRIEFTKP